MAEAIGGERSFEVNPERATLDDIEPIVGLWQEAAGWIAQTKGVVQWNPDMFDYASVLRYYDNTELFIVRDRDSHTIAGTCAIQWKDPVIWGELDNSESGYVHRLVVARSHSGLGIGKRLLDWAAGYIRERGKCYLRLDCMADNEGLNAYYKGAGFRYVGRVDKKHFSASLFEWHLRL